MTENPGSQPQDDIDVEPLLDRQDAGLPGPDHLGHAKMPPLDDDELAGVAARERVAAGIDDYVTEDVPPATDPLPDGTSEEADLAQRGLVEQVEVEVDDKQ